MSAQIFKNNGPIIAAGETHGTSSTQGELKKAEPGTASQECTTGNCKDCKCYCNIDIDDAVLSSICTNQTFLGKSRVEFIKMLNKYFKENDMNECIVKAHFLAQCAHESGNFNDVEEIHYKMMPKKDAAGNELKDKSGNVIKEKYWKDNYDKGSFGGQKYHGRGYIQLSSKPNYKAYFGHEPTDAEISSVASDIAHALGSSFWYWKKSWGKDIFSPYAKANDLTKSTRKLNKGLSGIFDRKSKLKSLGASLKIHCCKQYKEVWNNGNGIK